MSLSRRLSDDCVMIEERIAGGGEAELWARVRDGDLAAREQIMAENMQLVFWLARRFAGRGLEWDDLCQIGAIGLLKAIDNFRPELKNRFSTYAVPMIMGELRRAVRDDGLLHISRSYKEKIAVILNVGQQFLEERGREATISELAGLVNMSEGQVLEILEAGRRPVSLQTPLDNDGAGESELLDLLADGDDEEKWVCGLALREAFARLPDRMRYIMEARYYKEQTQEKIAAALGISQVQVSRLEKQALKLLREYWFS